MTATLAVDPLYLDRPDRNALARTLTRAAACAPAQVAAVLDELAASRPWTVSGAATEPGGRAWTALDPSAVA